MIFQHYPGWVKDIDACRYMLVWVGARSFAQSRQQSVLGLQPVPTGYNYDRQG